MGGLVLFALASVWYPPPLFGVGGGARLAGTIIAIDVILGPLLTLVVYRQGKPGLRFDLWCIAMIQVAALAYGLWVAAESRPVYIAATHQRATVVHANELYFGDASESDFAKPGWGGPALVFADAPDAREAREQLLFEVLDGFPDADYRPSLYLPIDNAPESFWQSGQPLSQLTEGDIQIDERALLRLQALHGNPPAESLSYLPLLTRHREIVLVLHAASRTVLGPVTVSFP